MLQIFRFCAVFIVIVAPLFSAVTSLAQSPAAYTPLSSELMEHILFSSGRRIVSLAGQWECSYNDGEPEQVDIPVSETRTGRFVYKRTVTIDAEVLKRHAWHLHCLGINYRADVRLNGQFLGSHIGGSVPFVMRIPATALREGINSVEITVSNVLNSSSTVPLRREPFGARTFGGIYREIFLVGTPQVWVSTVSLNTQFADNYTACRVDVDAMVSSGSLQELIVPGDSLAQGAPSAISKAAVLVSAELRNASTQAVVAEAVPQELTIESDRNTLAKLSLDVLEPRLWSPAKPQLYALHVRVSKNGLLIDEYVRSVGLRDIRRARRNGKSSFVLNGEVFDVKGVEYIEYKAGQGSTLTAADMDRDVLSLKTLGANTIRIRHSTPHPYLAWLCNYYGIFLLAELPVVQVPDGILATENFTTTAENILRELISVYKVHPALLGWGVADGLHEGSAAGKRYTERMRAIVRASSSQLMYKTVRSGAAAIDVADLDFLMINVEGRDELEFKAESTRMQMLAGDLPVLVNFGKAIQPDNHNGYLDPLSVEAQAKYLRDRYRILQEAGQSAGVMIWSFNDYYTDRPILVTNYPEPYLATCGLTAADREQRFTFELVQALFNDENEPFINSGTWKAASPFMYTIISVILLILIFLLMNGSRRFRENVLRALIRPYNFYSDIRDQRILSNVRTVILALVISGTLGMMLSTILYYLRHSYLLDYILMHLLPVDELKQAIDFAVWLPEMSTLAATLIFLALFFAVALVIRIGSFFVRSRIFFNDAFVISVWAGLPVVLLLILTMGLYKILEFGGYTEIMLVLVVIVAIWVLYRILRGTAVIYDVWAPNIYAVGIALVAVISVTLVVIYDAKYSIIDYFQYFGSVLYY